MALVNARWWMPVYFDDFGNRYENLEFKQKEDAPQFKEVAQIGFLNSDLYKPREGRAVCSNTSFFKPRHLEVTFNSGEKVIYPVPRTDAIDNMVRALKPSFFQGVVPGAGSSEAACIKLVGERWNLVPPAILNVPASEFRSTPLNANGFDRTAGKFSYNFEYVSDVNGVGKVRLPFAITTDSDRLGNCQREGMTAFEEGQRTLCNARGLGIKPRRLIMKTLAERDADSIPNVPGIAAQKNQYTINRGAPVSGIDSNGFLPGSDQAKAVALAIAQADCVQCFGWQGEDVDRVDLLVV